MNIAIKEIISIIPTLLVVAVIVIGCSSGNGSGSDTTDTSDTIPPSIPANVIATAVSTTQINLSWNASTDNIGVAGYRVYRDGNQIATVANTTYSNTGLSPSTTYTYTVSAYDAAGNNSAQSTIASATTLSENSSGFQFPLKLSANNRYLIDQNNTPFFLSGDTAWSLIAQLTKPDIDYYLDNRKQKGFNAILVNLLEHQFATSAPKNIYGDDPFTGQTFTTPNEAYFTHADYVINAAAQRGIVVFLDTLYLGYACGSEGWCAEVQSASLADMRSWGRYVGNRYKAFGNIIWVIGGDTDPIQVQSKVREFVSGIKDYDTDHLMTAHNQSGSYAITPWPNESWLNINNVYFYSTTIYQNSKTAYDHSPIMPYFRIESAYENEHGSTQQQLRAQAYWPALSGGFGYIFGNCPIWHFGSSAGWCGLTDWKSQLDAQGSVSMMHAQNLFSSRSWHLLVPDWNHTVMTAGYGSWGSTDYATAARTSDGASIIAYLLTSRTVTIDMTKLSGTQAIAQWYNPSTGASTLIGTYSTTGVQSFTPPSGDWVLTLDVV